MSSNKKNLKNFNPYCLGFNQFGKIGPVIWRRLENYFPDLKSAWQASSLELEKAGLKSKLVTEFNQWRKTCNVFKLSEELIQEKINYLTWHDLSYPTILKEISAPPPVLYYQGKLPAIDKKRLAVVGSRQHSAYAEKIIAELLPTIITNGIEIVSGLALGVDTLAHQTTLQAHGQTLAILGSGLKNIYPSFNRRLANEIIYAGGTIISEFAPLTPPYKQNFPQRNRLIAGISQATLVIEAREKSGALITANYALEQNREVLAVPGNIFSEFSTGPNNLIRAGAATITSSEDILNFFSTTSDPINNPPQQSLLEKTNYFKYLPENKAEAIICEVIKRASERSEKITADEIIRHTHLDTATVNSTLSILEIKGVIKNWAGNYLPV